MNFVEIGLCLATIISHGVIVRATDPCIFMKRRNFEALYKTGLGFI
ncbi:MAG: hypothetical protein QXS23_03100 [Desulfurococcaceae archaeon]